MKKQKIIYGLCCLLAVMGIVVSCQKHVYDFSYSPNSPKAGAQVSFTNLSDAGENWVWKFGDGGQSTSKNPTHIYTAAGTYVVELMADSNKSRTVSHVLEVLDSIPSINLASDTVQQYTPITFTASLYNPTKATVTYSWSVDTALFVITEGSESSDSLCGYFTDCNRKTDLSLTITVGAKTSTDTRTLVLTDKLAPTLLMQTQQGELWRQRIYEDAYEVAKPYEGDASDINAANDSTATLNGVTYDIHNMPVLTDLDVQALQVDAVNRKIYLILDDGLYVANANGDALTQLTTIPAATLLVDGERNIVFWSDAYGVWAMPLVTHPQNVVSEQQRSKILFVNEIKMVNRMTILEN